MVCWLPQVAPGTAPFITGPAMTPEQCTAAMAAGAAAVAAACTSSGSSASCSQPTGSPDAAAAAGRGGVPPPGAPLICVGELGLGNTTAAAALLAALTGATAEETCGRGTGEGQGAGAPWQREQQVVWRHADAGHAAALPTHGCVNVGTILVAAQSRMQGMAMGGSRSLFCRWRCVLTWCVSAPSHRTTCRACNNHNRRL